MKKGWRKEERGRWREGERENFTKVECVNERGRGRGEKGKTYFILN